MFENHVMELLAAIPILIIMTDSLIIAFREGDVSTLFIYLILTHLPRHRSTWSYNRILFFLIDEVLS